MQMASVTVPPSSSSTHLIHNLLRLPEPPSSFCLFPRPFCFSALTCQSSRRNKPRFQSISSKPLPFHSTSSLVAKSFSAIDEPDLGEDDESEEDEEEEEEEEEDDELDIGMVSVRGSEEGKEEKIEKMKQKARGSALKLTIKEKKELASYAHSLGDKLKCQLVGKSGVTDSVVFSFLETLEKNELLKVKIRKTSPQEMEDAVMHLEEATGSVAVGQIGRTVILYRPSPTKMKAEEKKKEVERLSIRRRQKFSNSRPNTRPFRREYSERPDGRGRRGGSRVATA
ncbi:bromo and FHA domain-containing protein DDB_G0267958 [Brassica rapa]|uniref:bromo and FHA domain-containing protein DDB_G0267958 n=1 Tax=Brassica campestris TaxID=3711 RepID=UPI00142D3CE8|nr:bromo and FHA domain-containing protein DDB_G0267958 [Brassica rapa]